jgi:hypothetical protein
LLAHVQTLKNLEGAHAQLVQEQQGLAQRQMMMSQGKQLGTIVAVSHVRADEVVRMQQHQAQLFAAIQQQASGTQQQAAVMHAQLEGMPFVMFCVSVLMIVCVCRNEGAASKVRGATSTAAGAAVASARSAALCTAADRHPPPRYQHNIVLCWRGMRVGSCALLLDIVRFVLLSNRVQIAPDASLTVSSVDATVADILELRAILRDTPALIRSINDGTNAQGQGVAVTRFCRAMLLVDSIDTDERKDWKGACSVVVGLHWKCSDVVCADDIVAAFEAAAVARVVPLMVNFLQRADLQVCCCG